MNPRMSRLFVILLMVLFMVAAVNLFTPFLGKARLGPMAGFSAPGGAGGIGPMSFGMMRDYSGLSGEELDLAFLQDMIPHHMAAVMMSQQLLSQVEVEHAELEELAGSIRSTQTQEIRQMSIWMDRWFD